MLLDNKVAIITGAASARGIGKATAQMFAAHGARVVIVDLDAKAASSAAAEIGDGHVGLACDVTERTACERTAEAVLVRFGRIDVLVNNAGVTQPLRVVDIGPADYDLVTGVSLRGSVYMSQAVIPAMRSRRAGSIICMSSVSAQRGGGILGGPHYSAAKAGVLDANGGMHIH